MDIIPVTMVGIRLNSDIIGIFCNFEIFLDHFRSFFGNSSCVRLGPRGTALCVTPL